MLKSRIRQKVPFGCLGASMHELVASEKCYSESRSKALQSRKVLSQREMVVLNGALVAQHHSKGLRPPSTEADTFTRPTQQTLAGFEAGSDIRYYTLILNLVGYKF